MKKIMLILLLFFTTFSISAFATPKRIIIIRHADKLLQHNKGHTLSPVGFVRAVKFAVYFLDRFGEPDYFFAKNPVNSLGKEISFRELQTLAPLVGMMEERRPNRFYRIVRNFSSSEYKQLAKLLLADKKFNDKVVLICWNHGRIPSLAAALGVSPVPAKWQSDAYDTVYVLDYASDGKLLNFTVLSDQYSVSSMPTWEVIYKSFKPFLNIKS